jgi:hypothetical protein
MILAKKLPQFTGVNLETVVVACILHDIGWATTKEILTFDRRFEVDGADIARRWLLEQEQAQWDANRLQLLWDSIALHTTGSIALHKQPEVALTHLGIFADFAGPRFPGGAITEDEYHEVVAAFPRAGFGPADMKEVMCALCKERTAATLDNFVGDFGRKYGYDGKGTGKEEYEAKWKAAQVSDMLMGGLEFLEGFRSAGKAEERA